MENIEKAFYHDGYKLGMRAISEDNQDELFQAIAVMYVAIDKLTESLFDFAHQQGQTIDCKKGCEWCCHQPIFALDYELDYLNYYIQKSFSVKEKEAISQRAHIKNDKLKQLKNDALLNSKHACPLLKKGACLAYEYRPMACRIYLSTNVNTCLKFFEQPDDKTNFPALLDFPMRAGRMMNEGFRAALKTKGRSVEEFRIEEKLV